MTLTVNKMSSARYQACLTVPGEITACKYARTPTAAATAIVRRTVGNIEKSGGFMGYSKRKRRR